MKRIEQNVSLHYLYSFVFNCRKLHYLKRFLYSANVLKLLNLFLFFILLENYTRIRIIVEEWNIYLNNLSEDLKRYFLYHSFF